MSTISRAESQRSGEAAAAERVAAIGGAADVSRWMPWAAAGTITVALIIYAPILYFMGRHWYTVDD